MSALHMLQTAVSSPVCQFSEHSCEMGEGGAAVGGEHGTQLGASAAPSLSIRSLFGSLFPRVEKERIRLIP